MKAIVATGFGDIDENVYMRTDWSTPILPQHENDDSNDPLLLIRVLACALAPGDARVLSGKTTYVQMPPSGIPYIIGSDISGIVVGVQSSSSQPSKFSVGDYVVSRFDSPKPNGGLAEYRLVKSSLTEHCPGKIPSIVSCGLPASAMAAKRIVREFVIPLQERLERGIRVLVLGGSGAVGSSVIQYCKLYGVPTVVAVSSQTELCQKLGADRVIDYRTTNWWEVNDFHNDNKFDIVFDMVNGKYNWPVGACSGKAVRSDGTYVALLTGVESEVKVHGVLDIIGIMFSFLGRSLYSRLNPAVPRWVAPEALKLEDGDLRELFKDVVDGKLKPLVDPSSPYPFTETGVREALKKQKSCHAHGKVVVKIAEK